jgi:pyridoxal phosphate enzyme (YggS family)
MNIEKYTQITQQLHKYGANLVAVSKTKPVEDILALYNAGQRIFGENKVQEMTTKYEQLPKDIQWHLIGHLQSNKVKYIAPYVSLIHSVDSIKLLQEIDKQAEKNQRSIPCLLQVYIANEDTKFGLSAEEAHALLSSPEYQALQHINIHGLMGMATNTDNEVQIATEFATLQQLYAELKTKYFANSNTFTQLSMGMSSDYHLALQHGATLVRVGSMLFGSR